MQESENQNIADLIAQSRKMQEDLDPNKHKINPDKPNAEDIVRNTVKKKEEAKVGGKDYKIVKYSVRDWLQVTPFLGRIFAPATTLLIQGELDSGAMVLFNELDDGVMESVVKVLLKNVTLQGQPVEIDSFEDPYELIEVCIKVVKLNYEKVFTKGMKDLAQALAHVTQAAQTL